MVYNNMVHTTYEDQCGFLEMQEVSNYLCGCMNFLPNGRCMYITCFPREHLDHCHKHYKWHYNSHL
jgi:hypothetical protein